MSEILTGNGADSDPHFGEQGGLLTYGGYLRLPELLVVAFTDDPVFVHQYSANHWVGRNHACTGFRQPEATRHIPFVNCQSMK